MKTTSADKCRFTKIVFTLNNYTLDEVEWFQSKDFTDHCKWAVIGKEVGKECGTPHLQGACVFKKQEYQSVMKSWPGFKRANFRRMDGTPQQSLAYCTKEDSKAFVFGECPVSKQGKRTDLHDVVDRVRSGESVREIASDSNGAVAVVKFYKGLTQLRSITRPQRSVVPRIAWIYGTTGTGKSEGAWECAQEICSRDNIWISALGLRWFDGYDGQRVAILDDFRPSDCKFSYLLRLLDKYPLRVEFKGGFVNWEPEWIFITTTNSIANTYKIREQFRGEDLNQLRRRITLGEFHFPEERGEFDRRIQDCLKSTKGNGSGELVGHQGLCNNGGVIQCTGHEQLLEHRRSEYPTVDRGLSIGETKEDQAERGDACRMQQTAKADGRFNTVHELYTGSVHGLGTADRHEPKRAGKCPRVMEVLRKESESRQASSEAAKFIPESEGSFSEEAWSGEEKQKEEGLREGKHGTWSSEEESEQSYETQVRKKGRRDMAGVDAEEEGGHPGTVPLLHRRGSSSPGGQVPLGHKLY